MHTDLPAKFVRLAVLLGAMLAPAVRAAADKAADPEDVDELLRRLAVSIPAPASPSVSTATTRPATVAAPATQPAAGPTTRSLERREGDTKRVFDFLMKEYSQMLAKSKDRMGRSLTIVCLARIPRADATAQLLSLLKAERDPLVRMVCWESLLARANGLSEAEYKQWSEATKPLIETNVFRGDLRVALLRLLAVAPPDTSARNAFAKIFENSNSMDARDYPTLGAMGETLKAWGDPALVDSMLAHLADINSAQRAEVVLHAAGCDVSYAAARRNLGSDQMWKLAQQDYAEWWKKQKSQWKVRGRTEPGEWQKLAAQYIPGLDMDAVVDPNEKKWYRDLELRPPNLHTFSVGLLVDTTGSMGRVLVWLRSDVKRIMEALGFVSLEPQITITFYRDHGDSFVAKTYPLTGKIDTLVTALEGMNAEGGGDIPEAVREALTDSLANGKWPTSVKQPKAMVLIGDAPPHPETQAECEKLVADAAAKGFRLYAVKVRTGYEADDLSAFDKLASVGHGESFWTDMRLAKAMSLSPGDGRKGKFAGKGMGKKGGLGSEAVRGMTALGSAVDAEESSPGEWIVTKVLTDAINPQFAERIRPPVAILWQMLKDPVKETHAPFPPPPPPQPSRGPKMQKPPFDPQKQRGPGAPAK